MFHKNISLFRLVYNMASVEKCPETLTAVNESSKQLNCGIDTYGNNQYMCLPNMEKSSLVEFCYDGIMGIQKEGKQYLEISTYKTQIKSMKSSTYDDYFTNYYYQISQKMAIYYKNIKSYF